MNEASAAVYIRRIKLFRAYCIEHRLEERKELTFERVTRFVVEYSCHRNLDPHAQDNFLSAL
ncbi:MAG: hypothetical protein KGJ79_12740 [Alphaproteobacteria bacterium]|nr:hypothetical protein [Alphaproteobacteria bacterium]MDE2112003.1 hypothetical protein [Alphaproteobacteria bacterium]MDE2492339.1 hypothetical protein [Alphaproteobacteria bacterium]